MKGCMFILFCLMAVLVCAKRAGKKGGKVPSAYESFCPKPVLCPTVPTSDGFRRVKQFFLTHAGLCPGCGTTVARQPELDEYGCPVRSCPTGVSKPENCAHLWFHKQYIVFRRKLCHDCGAYTCHNSPSSSFSMGIARYMK